MKGYTLLEVLVAMSLFLCVLVPLAQRFAVAIKTTKSMDTLTASCLIEQESAAVMQSDSYHPVTRHKTIQGHEWTIKSAISGNKLRDCSMVVYKNKKMVETVHFHFYSE